MVIVLDQQDMDVSLGKRFLYLGITPERGIKCKIEYIIDRVHPRVQTRRSHGNPSSHRTNCQSAETTLVKESNRGCCNSRRIDRPRSAHRLLPTPLTHTHLLNRAMLV